MNTKMIAGIAVAVALAVGGWFVFGQNTGPGSTAITQSSSVSDVDTSAVKDFYIGDTDAPITIYEYASFTCPYCATFHENAFKQLKADYIETGKVRFAFREVYFDRYGLWAGMVARCDDGRRYHGIVDLLFEGQRQWTRGEPAAIAANLKRLGKLAGMDDATLDACLQDAPKAEALNAYYQENAEKDNVRTTPSFVINGTTYGNMSYEDFKKILDAELG